MIQSSVTTLPSPTDHSRPSQFVAGDQVAVLLSLPVDAPYDYLVPENLTLSAGDIVEVPLGRRLEIGVIWGIAKGEVEPEKLKEIFQRLDLPRLSDVSRRFIDWVADYNLQAKGVILRMSIRVAKSIKPRPASVILSLVKNLPDGLRLTHARRNVLTVLQSGSMRGISQLAKQSAVSASVVNGLIKAGVVKKTTAAPEPIFEQPDPEHHGYILEPEQRSAAMALASSIGQGFSVHVLEGVTGSGKTEVYFEAVAAALRAGKQVLVLLPEIALTSQWLERFEKRFGVAPAVWHSNISGGVRRETWRAVAESQAQVLVGARSALFLPFASLGLIVVDEEHDAAFKQEEGVIYHARDMAVVRSREGDIPIILASATPSLETIVNVEAGRYKHIQLPHRVQGATLPVVQVVDMISTPTERGRWGRSWLAPPLVEAIEETLADENQVLLFLNRRGYAPLTLCSACGYRLHCPSCTAWLVEHRLTKLLQCHHCGFAAPQPDKCPTCGKTEHFVPCGPGIERVAEEAAARWPGARVVAVDGDTLERPSAMAELVEAMERRHIDIVVGTQVLAKGHHFPGLTLVGVVDADLGLSSWDLRAGERTHQLLHQVAGRAGRGREPGRVLLQTYESGHPVLQALTQSDKAEFIRHEADGRRALGMPPFGRLVSLILSGLNEQAVVQAGASLAKEAPKQSDLTILGPAPALMALLRGRHRHRFLIKGPRNRRLQPIIKAWLEDVKVPSSVRIQVDVDPHSFY
ncbi:MAG: primosomal protein N' [Rhodospirillaceae bacterium]